MSEPLPIVDTHVHFWDLRRPPEGLAWSWLDPADDHPILGDIDPMKSPRFDLEALWGEARFAGVDAFVHVQAAIGSADPVDETRWLERMRTGASAPLAIVGHADLATDHIEAQLDSHLEASSAFVGVRDFAIEPLLRDDTDATLDRGLRALTQRGLLLDLDCEWPQMPRAATLARRHPGLTIVLEHIGFPRRRDDDYFASWRAGIATLAAEPNVMCKLSGLGMTDPRFTTTSLRRWVDTCVEEFGPDRAMFGSNWPIDRLYSSYDALTGVVRTLLESLAIGEQQAILAGNARSVYRVG